MKLEWRNGDCTFIFRFLNCPVWHWNNALAAMFWQQCFGGSGDENGYQIVPVSDVSFYIGGTTSSNDGDASGNHGLYDFWILHCDSFGTFYFLFNYSLLFTYKFLLINYSLFLFLLPNSNGHIINQPDSSTKHCCKNACF